MKKYLELEINVCYFSDDTIRTSKSSGADVEPPELGENEMPFIPFG